MRRKALYVIVLSIIIIVINGCGGREREIKPVKGSSGVEYTSYEDACRDNDFVAAYKFIELNGGDKDYVFKHEALFLMSQYGEDAKKRLIYLLKQEGGGNHQISMLIDLVIVEDDEDFVKQLANQYNKYVSSSELKALSEYLLSKDKEGNKEYLLSLYRKFNKDDMILEYAPEEWLDNQIERLAHVTLEGERLPKGLVECSYYERDEKLKYQSSVAEYNKKLDEVLDQAILQNKKQHAQKVINLYKQNMNAFIGGSGHSKNDPSGITRYFEIAPDGTEVGSDYCYITYDYRDRDAAKEKFKEHFRR